MANIATIRVTSFDGVDTTTGQAHRNAVHTRVNRVISRSADRWHGSSLPPVTLTLLVDGTPAGSVTLSGLQLNPLVRGRFVATALAALEVTSAEGWALVDTSTK